MQFIFGLVFVNLVQAGSGHQHIVIIIVHILTPVVDTCISECHIYTKKCANEV